MVRLGALVVRVGFAVGRLRPLRAHVVLASQRTTEIRGNLLYIKRELEGRTPPIPMVVLAYRTEPGLRGRIKGVGQALRSGYHLATARLFVVDEWFLPMDVITPRSGTIRVQTWHAAGAFKKFGYSLLDKSFGADDEMIRIVDIHSNYDLCLVSSQATAAYYMDAFRLPRDRFTATLGLPRTDVLFDTAQREHAANAIRDRYQLPPDRKVLLYAPTFRGDTVRAARYDDNLDLVVMRAALEAEWVVLLRLHPFVRTSVSVSADLASFVIDVSGWPDMNDLMVVTDLLVTDYSSSIFEFALLGRAMAFLAPDHDAYQRERGFYIDFPTSMPGPIFETTEALAAWVKAGTFDLERSRAFARDWFDVADGHASGRFVERVVLPALRGDPLRLEDPSPDAREP